MNKPTLLSRIQGCLLGVRIGDAMGVPWEMYARDQIMEETGGKGVTGFQNSKNRRFEEMRDLALGEISDDTIFTDVVVRSLIRCKGFDLGDSAREHLAAFEGPIFGMGRATRSGLQSLKEGRDPLTPAPDMKPGKGSGNGVIMKVSGLALFHAVTHGPFSDGFKREPLFMQVMQLGRMTHPDPRASLAAYAVARIIATVLHDPVPSPGVSPSKYDWHVDGLLGDLAQEITHIEDGLMYGVSQFSDDPLSWRLGRLSVDGDALVYDREALRKEIGTACFALESGPFAIGTFLLNPTNFKSGVLEAINAGGDTDSNASIVGALIGANCGAEAIPQDWIRFNPKFQEAFGLGEALCKAALTT
ncbi:MAG: ADP-ribosylglycohydrolase family protein [bacterium]|nr:ADP-ribosylglycohydrolase family protein [bacterium]